MDKLSFVLEELKKMRLYYDTKRSWCAGKIAEGGKIDFYIASAKICNELIIKFDEIIKELENGK